MIGETMGGDLIFWHLRLVRLSLRKSLLTTCRGWCAGARWSFSRQIPTTPGGQQSLQFLPNEEFTQYLRDPPRFGGTVPSSLILL